MREYLRPYYAGLFLMIIAALLAVSAEIAIPLITKSVIDSAILQSTGRCWSSSASPPWPSARSRLAEFLPAVGPGRAP